MATHSVFLPGKSHAEKNLVGYSPGLHKELGSTEQAEFKIFWILKTNVYLKKTVTAYNLYSFITPKASAISTVINTNKFHRK